MLLVIRKHPEAEAMVRWGTRISKATDKPLYILWVESGDEDCDAELDWQPWGNDVLLKDPDWENVVDALADAGALEIKVCKVASKSRYLTVLNAERHLSPELIVVGRHSSFRDADDGGDSDDESKTGRLARQLLAEAYSAVLVLRLGSLTEDDPSPLTEMLAEGKKHHHDEEKHGASDDGESSEPVPSGILVPCAGGRHSRLGMRLAAEMAGKDATALFVESDIDEFSPDVGYAHLKATLKRAGVSPDDVSLKVALSEKVSDAISRELKTRRYQLMIIGATGVGSLRRKLFGTVPQRLMNGSHGMSIGVIRAARPTGWRMRERIERVLSMSVPQLKREDRIELFAEIEGKSRWCFDFAVLMILATAIASLGLLANSGAVVIGAMLVAPLMMPLLGGGLAVVQGNWLLWKQCQKSVILGFFYALSVGVILGYFALWTGQGVTGELLARGAPTLLDLGVAFLSGLAAAYCLSRPGLSGALAGVAISAALVPPIATTGVCLAMGEYQIARGAALLFGTNVVAIVLGAALNFLFAGVRGKKTSVRLWVRRLAILLALACAGLSVPLASELLSRASREVSMDDSMKEMFQKQGFQLVGSTMTRDRDGSRVLNIQLDGPGFPSEFLLQSLKPLIQERYGKGVKIRVQLNLVKEIK